MACHQFERQLTEFVLGELSAEDRSTIENHLANCDNCRAYVTSLSNLTQSVVTSCRAVSPPQAALSAERRAALRRAAASTPCTPAAKPLWQRFSFQSWAFALSTAALVLITIIGNVGPFGRLAHDTMKSPPATVVRHQALESVQEEVSIGVDEFVEKAPESLPGETDVIPSEPTRRAISPQPRISTELIPDARSDGYPSPQPESFDAPPPAVTQDYPPPRAVAPAAPGTVRPSQPESRPDFERRRSLRSLLPASPAAPVDSYARLHRVQRAPVERAETDLIDESWDISEQSLEVSEDMSMDVVSEDVSDDFSFFDHVDVQVWIDQDDYGYPTPDPGSTLVLAEVAPLPWDSRKLGLVVAIVPCEVHPLRRIVDVELSFAPAQVRRWRRVGFEDPSFSECFEDPPDDSDDFALADHSLSISRHRTLVYEIEPGGSGPGHVQGKATVTYIPYGTNDEITMTVAIDSSKGSRSFSAAPPWFGLASIRARLASHLSGSSNGAARVPHAELVSVTQVLLDMYPNHLGIRNLYETLAPSEADEL